MGNGSSIAEQCPEFGANQERSISYQEVLDIMRRMGVTLDTAHLRALMKEQDPRRSGLLDLAAFRRIYKRLVHRPELTELYNILRWRHAALSPSRLCRFLIHEQQEAEVDKNTATRLIERYEIMLEARRENYLTLEGFIRYMNCENSILRGAHRYVYQDMSQPLNHYYISSSHNTYLLSNQLLGQSHLYAYRSALMRGCRCLEIDCWDGDEDEPIVYHGFTLTSKLLFRSVLSVISQYAFLASPYPLILSLENHCSPRQQEVMRRQLTTILGDKLLTMPVCDTSPGVLPSPEALKGKILIKHKKEELLQDTTPRPTPCEVIEEVEPAEEKEQRRHSSITSMIPQTKVETPMIPPPIPAQLSDLVIYTKSTKFISFQDSKEHQKYYENNSLSERAAQRLVQDQAQEFVRHTSRFLTRIYPKGSRAESSNFNPQQFWNVGCQMVALNYQTPGIPMDLYMGRFLDNGGCGYVLKPEFLQDDKFAFDPEKSTRRNPPMLLTIKVISGFLLPHGSASTINSAELIAKVEIYGMPPDMAQQRTQAVKHGALNPQWQQSMTFFVQVPELALVRFSLEDRLPLIRNEFLGQYTLPLTSMAKGYRHVPLLNKHGQSMAPASLFIHVWYQ
ncbi:1-phosphatidylinositol 4,5-bisphosphate phosphodiesterase zeta-1 [Dendropsophus ebraccatus]|uniref:1-phosphatidylinositol 4,5-bisphosphate phosphodiesterase zeta-1 n=1 Tax=Dendropsophus ebraccatus TaxID=150705 RepID=UPI00383106DD